MFRFIGDVGQRFGLVKATENINRETEFEKKGRTAAPPCCIYKIDRDGIINTARIFSSLIRRLLGASPRFKLIQLAYVLFFIDTKFQLD